VTQGGSLGGAFVRDGAVWWHSVDPPARSQQQFAIMLHNRAVGKLLRETSVQPVTARPQHSQGRGAAAWRQGSVVWIRIRAPRVSRVLRRSYKRAYILNRPSEAANQGGNRRVKVNIEAMIERQSAVRSLRRDRCRFSIVQAGAPRGARR